jgi:hypothetical protein
MLICKKKTMKKIIIYSVSCLFGIALYTQLKPKDVFSQDEVVWYGLDFSKTKFIGSFENVKKIRPINDYVLKDIYIPAWNHLIVNEPTNFDIKKTFYKKKVYYDLRSIESINKTIDTNDLITLNSNTISQNDLQDMVDLYKKGNKKEGLGLSFIIESFDKPNEQASLWVVFFDIESKKILLSKHCVGKPTGFGIRNYWAGAIKHIMNEIRYSKYKKWDKETVCQSDITTIVKK